MRWCAAAIAILLCACGDDGAPDRDMAVDLGRPPDLFMCATDCAPCASGTVCVHDAYGSFAAACLAACHDSRDCTGGTRCAEFGGATPRGRYCIDNDTPAVCKKTCFSDTYGQCDGNVAINFYLTPAVCGVVYDYCERGCIAPFSDGGFGNIHSAMCRL